MTITAALTRIKTLAEALPADSRKAFVKEVVAEAELIAGKFTPLTEWQLAHIKEGLDDIKHGRLTELIVSATLLA